MTGQMISVAAHRDACQRYPDRFGITIAAVDRPDKFPGRVLNIVGSALCVTLPSATARCVVRPLVVLGHSTSLHVSPAEPAQCDGELWRIGGDGVSRSLGLANHETPERAMNGRSVRVMLRTPQVGTYSADRRDDHVVHHSLGKVRKSFLDLSRRVVGSLACLVRLDLQQCQFRRAVNCASFGTLDAGPRDHGSFGDALKVRRPQVVVRRWLVRLGLRHGRRLWFAANLRTCRGGLLPGAIACDHSLVFLDEFCHAIRHRRFLVLPPAMPSQVTLSHKAVTTALSPDIPDAELTAAVDAASAAPSQSSMAGAGVVSDRWAAHSAGRAHREPACSAPEEQPVPVGAAQWVSCGPSGATSSAGFRSSVRTSRRTRSGETGEWASTLRIDAAQRLAGGHCSALCLLQAADEYVVNRAMLACLQQALELVHGTSGLANFRTDRRPYTATLLRGTTQRATDRLSSFREIEVVDHAATVGLARCRSTWRFAACRIDRRQHSTSLDNPPHSLANAVHKGDRHANAAVFAHQRFGLRERSLGRLQLVPCGLACASSSHVVELGHLYALAEFMEPVSVFGNSPLNSSNLSDTGQRLRGEEPIELALTALEVLPRQSNGRTVPGVVHFVVHGRLMYRRADGSVSKVRQ